MCSGPGILPRRPHHRDDRFGVAGDLEPLFQLLEPRLAPGRGLAALQGRGHGGPCLLDGNGDGVENRQKLEPSSRGQGAGHLSRSQPAHRVPELPGQLCRPEVAPHVPAPFGVRGNGALPGQLRELPSLTQGARHLFRPGLGGAGDVGDPQLHVPAIPQVRLPDLLLRDRDRIPEGLGEDQIPEPLHVGLAEPPGDLRLFRVPEGPRLGEHQLAVDEALQQAAHHLLPRFPGGVRSQFVRQPRHVLLQLPLSDADIQHLHQGFVRGSAAGDQQEQRRRPPHSWTPA